MNKDALLATIIGFGVGLVITGLVFIGPSLIKTLPSIQFPALTLPKIAQNTKAPKKSQPSTKAASNDLTIDSPLAENIQPKNEILVSGHTAFGATVVIVGETGENVVVANDQGAYAGTIALGEGKNDIEVTSYAKTQTQKQSVTVYYTPENF